MCAVVRTENPQWRTNLKSSVPAQMSVMMLMSWMWQKPLGLPLQKSAIPTVSFRPLIISWVSSSERMGGSNKKRSYRMMTTVHVLENSLNHQQLNWVPHELKVLRWGWLLGTKALVLLYYCGLDGTSTTSLRYIVLLWSFQPRSRCTNTYNGSLRKYIPTQGNNPGKLKHAAAITTSIPEEK